MISQLRVKIEQRWHANISVTTRVIVFHLQQPSQREIFLNERLFSPLSHQSRKKHDRECIMKMELKREVSELGSDVIAPKRADN